MDTSLRYRRGAITGSGLAIGVIALIVIGCHLAIAHGLGTRTGREWQIWTAGKCVVVLATVNDVTFVPESRTKDVPNFSLKLTPITTLAGTFDPSERQTIVAEGYFGAGGTSNRDPPPKGSTALIVIVMFGGPPTAGEYDDFTGPPPATQPITYFIVSDICTFMPNRASICEVNGLGDPKVMQTIEKLREARANRNPNPYHPSTQPTTQPTTR